MRSLTPPWPNRSWTPSLRKSQRADASRALLEDKYPQADHSPALLDGPRTSGRHRPGGRVHRQEGQRGDRDPLQQVPEPEDFAGASQATLEAGDQATGFFRNKARSVIALSKAIVEKHGGKSRATWSTWSSFRA